MRVTRERKFSLRHSLLGAARMAYEDAEAERPGWAYSRLTCITLSALALEALANAFLKELVEEWQDFERSSTKAKIRIIAEKLSIKPDFEGAPWSNVGWLLGLRNDIVHAKPDHVKNDSVWTREKYDRTVKEPASKLERQLTLGNAKKALSTTEQIKDLSCDALPVEKQFGLRSESWIGSARHLNDE